MEVHVVHIVDRTSFQLGYLIFPFSPMIISLYQTSAVFCGQSRRDSTGNAMAFFCPLIKPSFRNSCWVTVGRVG